VLTDVLINGEKKYNLDIADRGLQYGDGLFETIAVTSGRAVFISRHLDRLQRGCKQLFIPYPGDNILLSEIDLLLEGTESAVLKIQITRGQGGRGYRQPEIVEPTRILSLYPFPIFPECYKQEGVRVRFCSGRLSSNPRLAGIKHTNRLEQVLARAEWVSESIQEGLMFDQQGHLVEGTMSNVFMVKDGMVLTPLLENCGVAGIIRGIILEYGADHGFHVEPQLLTKEHLYQADEVFLTNSIIGIWPVSHLDNYSLSVGAVTHQINQCLDQLKTQDIQL
jgi:4-amino-4-deoxychorismate lyase